MKYTYFKTKYMLSSAVLMSCGMILASCGGGGDEPPVVTPPPPPPPANSAPVISSVDTGITVEENDPTFQIRFSATDAEGDDLAWSLREGDDSAFFMIDATSGLVTLVDAFDHEQPQDADADNEYSFTVVVSDGSDEASANVTVGVEDVFEDPTCITSGDVEYVESDARPSIWDVWSVDVPDGDATLTLLAPGTLKDVPFSNYSDIDTGEVGSILSVDYEDFLNPGPYDVSGTASLSDGTKLDCPLSLTLVDVPGMAVSGARITGDDLFTAYLLDDLENEGKPEYFVSGLARSASPSDTEIPQGRIVRSSTVSPPLSADGNLNAEMEPLSVEVFANFERPLSAAPDAVRSIVGVDPSSSESLSARMLGFVPFDLPAGVTDFDEGAMYDTPVGVVLSESTLLDSARSRIDLSDLAASDGTLLEASGLSGAYDSGLASGRFSTTGADDLIFLRTSPFVFVSKEDPVVVIATNSAFTNAGKTFDFGTLSEGEGILIRANHAKVLPDLDGDGLDEMLFWDGPDFTLLPGASIKPELNVPVSSAAMPEFDLSDFPDAKRFSLTTDASSEVIQSGFISEGPHAGSFGVIELNFFMPRASTYYIYARSELSELLLNDTPPDTTLFTFVDEVSQDFTEVEISTIQLDASGQPDYLISSFGPLKPIFPETSREKFWRHLVVNRERLDAAFTMPASGLDVVSDTNGAMRIVFSPLRFTLAPIGLMEGTSAEMAVSLFATSAPGMGFTPRSYIVRGEDIEVSLNNGDTSFEIKPLVAQGDP